MSAKHTPGPWTIQGSLIVGQGQYPITQLPIEPTEGTMADARLILAAPELLKALKLAAACLKRKRFDEGHLDEINAAIAKAEGEP